MSTESSERMEVHTSMLLMGGNTDLGALRTHNAIQERQAKVMEATRRLLQSESMVHMLQEAGVELPTIEELTMGRRRATTVHGTRGDWRSALNKNHAHPQAASAAAAADAGGAGGEAAAETGTDEASAAAAAAAPTADAAAAARDTPRKKQDNRGGWRNLVPHKHDGVERNPVIRRLKKLRHKVLFGKIGEKAYERYKATLRANLTWRDILRPNLSAAKRNGHNQPGFSRWLDRAITAEQKMEVRNEAARVIQNAWRNFKRQRIESVMQHVRNYEMGNYEWSDDDSVASEDLSDSSSSDGKDGGKKKKGKLKRGKSIKKKDPAEMKKRAVLAAVAGAMDEETMGDAVVAGAPKRAARRRRKKKAEAGGDGSDDGAEDPDGEGAGDEAGEAEEGGESAPGSSRRSRRSRRGRRAGEEAVEEEGLTGVVPEGGEALAGEESTSSADRLKRAKSARRRPKTAKSRPASPPVDDEEEKGEEANAGAQAPDFASLLANMEQTEGKRSSRSALASEAGANTPEVGKKGKGKKGKKGDKGDKAAAVEAAEGTPLADAGSSQLKQQEPAGGEALLPTAEGTPGPGTMRTQDGSSASGITPPSTNPSPVPPEDALSDLAATSGLAAGSRSATPVITPLPEPTSDPLTARSLLSEPDDEHDTGTSGTGDGAGTGDGSGARSGKVKRGRKKRTKRRSEAVSRIDNHLTRMSEPGPGPSGASGAGASRFAARLTTDTPDWSKVGHHAALFDATTDVNKRAAMLARMARDAGPGWKPNGGVIGEWYDMSHELYKGEDPEKRAEAMAKVAATVAATGHPLWRPGGGAIHDTFAASRSLYDGDDPGKRAEAMVRVAATASPTHPMWRPSGVGPGISALTYDRGLYEPPEPQPAQKAKFNYKEMPPWKPPGVPRVDYYNYYRSSGVSSSGSSSTESEAGGAEGGEAGEDPEERAQRRAARREEKRAARERRRTRSTAGVEGTGTIDARYNTRKPWRFAYAVEDEPPPPGNDPAAVRFDHVLRDDKPGGPKPWKYTVIADPDRNVPYNIWGPYVEPSPYRFSRYGNLAGAARESREGDGGTTPRVRRLRPMSARMLRPQRATTSTGDGLAATGDGTAPLAGEPSSAAVGPDGTPAAGKANGRAARPILRRSRSSSQLEMRTPGVRRAMSARARIAVPPPPPGGIPSHIVLSPEAAAALAAEVSAASVRSGASGAAAAAAADAAASIALRTASLMGIAPSIPSQSAGQAPGLISVKGRAALPGGMRASAAPQAAQAAESLAPQAQLATAQPAGAPPTEQTTAEASVMSVASAAPPSVASVAEVSFAGEASAGLPSAGPSAAGERSTYSNDGLKGEPSQAPTLGGRTPSQAVSFVDSTEPSRSQFTTDVDSPLRSAMGTQATDTIDDDGVPDLSGPLAVLAGAIAMGAGVLMSAVAAPPPDAAAAEPPELLAERSAAEVAAAAATVAAAAEAVAAALSSEASVGPPGPPQLLPAEASEASTRSQPQSVLPQEELSQRSLSQPQSLLAQEPSQPQSLLPQELSQQSLQQQALSRQSLLPSELSQQSLRQQGLPPQPQMEPSAVSQGMSASMGQASVLSDGLQGPLAGAAVGLSQVDLLAWQQAQLQQQRMLQQQALAAASQSQYAQGGDLEEEEEEEEEEESAPPAWLYAMPSYASTDVGNARNATSHRRRALGRRRTVDDDEQDSHTGVHGGTRGRRERSTLHPPPCTDPADSAPKLKRICSARGVGAFTTTGIQPYPLDPALLRGVPQHLLPQSQGRARSAPGSPRTFITGELSSATAATAGTAGTGSSGQQPEAEVLTLTESVADAVPYNYVYGYSPPGTAASVTRAEQLSRHDLPPLPAILEDPRAQEFLASRGNKILTQRRLAAKGAAQPDPRAMYELLFLGRRVEQHRQQQYVAGSLSAAGHGHGSGHGVHGSGASHTQRGHGHAAASEAAAAMGAAGSRSLAALADAHVKAQAQLYPGQSLPRFHNTHGEDVLSRTAPAALFRSMRPLGEQAGEQHLWASGPLALSAAATAAAAVPPQGQSAAAAAAPALAWGGAGAPFAVQHWQQVPQQQQQQQHPGHYHALPPVRAASTTSCYPPVGGVASAAAGRDTSPIRMTPPATAGSVVMRGRVSHTQYTVSIATTSEGKDATAPAGADGPMPTHGSPRPGSGGFSGTALDPLPQQQEAGPDAVGEFPMEPLRGSISQAMPQTGLQPTLGRSIASRSGSRTASISNIAGRAGSTGLIPEEQAAGAGSPVLPPIASQQQPGAPALPPQPQQAHSPPQPNPQSSPNRAASDSQAPPSWSAAAADQPNAASPTRLPAVSQKRGGRQPPPPPPPPADAEAQGEGFLAQRRRLKGQLRTGRAPLGPPLALRMPERPPGAV